MSSDVNSENVVRSSVDLWQLLQDQGGLQPTTYDKDLVENLFAELGLAQCEFTACECAHYAVFVRVAGGLGALERNGRWSVRHVR